MELVNPLLVNLMAIAAIAAGLALAAWWIAGLYWMQSRQDEEKLRQIKFPAELREAASGIPAALVIFYVFMGLTLIGYVLYAWLGGVTY